MTAWKTSYINLVTPNYTDGRTHQRSVRTNGEVVQICEVRSISKPYGTIEDFVSSFASETAGLVDVTMELETHAFDDYGVNVAESDLLATGWRENLTDEEMSAVKALSFL